MDIKKYEHPKEYPDWRWTRVLSLVEEQKTPDKRDDKYIHRGFRFARDLKACDGSDTALFTLSMNHREVSKAYGLYNNGSRRSNYIEACALCWDIDEKGIAEYMGEGQHMVRYYLKLFFDVPRPKRLCLRPVLSRTREEEGERSLLRRVRRVAQMDLKHCAGDARCACVAGDERRPRAQSHAHGGVSLILQVGNRVVTPVMDPPRATHAVYPGHLHAPVLADGILNLARRARSAVSFTSFLVRISIPRVSIMMAMFAPACWAAARSRSMRPLCSAWVPWDRLRRATLMPA